MAKAPTGAELPDSRHAPAPPRIIVLSGMIFSLLFTASVILLRLAVPTDPMDPGSWLADPDLRNGVRISLSLVPYAGIAFLWYMGVLRNRIGELEDRFFATVFLGSGLLFVAMLFAGAAVSQGLLGAFGPDVRMPRDSETYVAGRQMVHVLQTTFALKMAAVFMFVTSMIGFRTAALSRWVAFVGFAFALAFLLAITDIPWLALLFPCWVMLVSVWMLVEDLRRRRLNARAEKPHSESG